MNNKLKSGKGNTFKRTRDTFKNAINKQCYYCKYNQDGYCLLHNAKTCDAIGICSTQKNETYITYQDKVYKMPKSLDVNNHIKKQCYSKTHYEKMRQKQMAKEQIKICHACEQNKSGWCSKNSKWCNLCWDSCATLKELKRTYKLKKRKKSPTS